MYCLAISQKHDSQITFTHFTNLSPTTNSTILLDEFILWKFHSPNYPFVLDYCTIGAVSVDVKVVCDFHSPMVAEWAGLEISAKDSTGCRIYPGHPGPRAGNQHPAPCNASTENPRPKNVGYTANRTLHHQDIQRPHSSAEVTQSR